jgi:hypothetical protein
MAQKIADQATFDAVKVSAKNYRDYCEREHIEFSKILTFPSFWDEWRDWLDPENGKSKLSPKPNSKTMSDDEFFAGIRKQAGA